MLHNLAPFELYESLDRNRARVGAARSVGDSAKLRRGMKRQRFAIAARAALGLALAGSVAAHAQDSGPQLAIDRLAYIESGVYLAGDSVTFNLDSAGNNYLLRFAGSPEIFVLYVDHGSLGGRILKYDSGETALKVTGWGGMTLYTDAAPQGLPAVRTGDSTAPAPTSVSLQAMQSVASDESERLAYVRRLNIPFTADWNALSDNAGLRALACDAMENAARGIERFTGSNGAHDAFARRVGSVAIEPAPRTTIALNGRTLVVTFNPDRGFVGRASSRAIARALGTLLAH